MAKSRKKKTGVKKKAKTIARKKPATRTSKATTKRSLPRVTLLEEVVIENADYGNVTEERSSILSIVRGLEGQVETAFKLKEVLEEELETAQKRLSEELSARAELEARLSALEIEAALVEHLREDISFAEQERNSSVELLGQIQPQLEAITLERDSLTGQVAAMETNIGELDNDRTTLEAQVMNLKDKVSEMERLRGQLDDLTGTRVELTEKVRELSRDIDASDTSKGAFEKELVKTKEIVSNLNVEVEYLQKNLTDSETQVADLRIRLEDQQIANRNLVEVKARLEGELKMLNINYESAKNEIKGFKNALYDIRSEATRTSGRVRQRYFKPDNGGSQSKKTKSSRSLNKN